MRLSFPYTDLSGILKTGDGKSLFAYLAECLTHTDHTLLSVCGKLAGLLLLASLWKRYRECVRDSGTGSVFSLVCTALAALWGMQLLETALGQVASFSNTATQIMTAAAASLTALYAVRGMTAAAAVAGTALALFFACAEAVCSGILLPLTRICCGLTAASAFGGETLSGLAAWLRKTFLTLIGALMTLLTAVLSCQNVLAQSADSISLRAVKFALSGAVPVIGGAVSEAAAVMQAGLSFTQKTTGMIGILLLIWQLLPPLCTVFLTRLVLSAGAAFAGMLSLDKEGKVLGDMAGLAGFLCAVMAAQSVLYILMLSLCMRGG